MSEDISNIRKYTNTRSQVRNLIKEFNLSRQLSVPTETLDYLRQQVDLDGLIEVSDDQGAWAGTKPLRQGYFLTFEPDYEKLVLWHRMDAPWSISLDSSGFQRNGEMHGIPLPIKSYDNGLVGSIQLATGFDGVDDWVDIPHDPAIMFYKVKEGFTIHIKFAPCDLQLNNGQPVTLYSKKDPISPRGFENAIIAVLMSDGSLNVKLTFEGVEYTASAPQYFTPQTTEFGITHWYDHTVRFSRVRRTLDLFVDNVQFNIVWADAHLVPYPYSDTDWHIGRSTYTNRGLWWGGLGDFRFYHDLCFSNQNESNLFNNRISISNIAYGQCAVLGHSYITHSSDIGFFGGFLPPLINGTGFMMTPRPYFLFISEPVTNDIIPVYKITTYPKEEADLALIYDVVYTPPVTNQCPIIYDIQGGQVLPETESYNDVLIQYSIRGGTPTAICDTVVVDDGGGGGGGTQPPPTGAVFKFNIAGDFRSGSDAEATADNLVSDNPDVMFFLGDYAVGDASEEEWCNTIMAPVKNSGKPVWGVNGNHDNDNYLDVGFFQNTSWVWSVKYGNIMFISCDTVAENVSATQTLVAAAQNNPAIMRIVIVMHESIFKQENGGTSGSDTTTAYHTMFKQYPKLKLVIAGHSHNWTRFAPYQGIQYIINEDGGQQPDSDTGCMHCSSDVYGNLTLSMVSNGGDTLDTFTIPADTTGGGGGGTDPPVTRMECPCPTGYLWNPLTQRCDWQGGTGGGTQPPPIQPEYKIGVVSDWDGSPRQTNCDLMKAKGVTTVVIPGDFTHGDNADSAIDILNSMGSNIAGCNAFDGIGNHADPNEDGNQGTWDQEKAYFCLEELGDEILVRARQIYNVYFITLCTQDTNMDSNSSPQYAWFQSKLQEAQALKAQNKVHWIIVAFHKPFYSLSTDHPQDEMGARSLYTPLFQQYAVDFVFSGHNHVLNYSKPLTGSNQVTGTQLSNGVWDFTKTHGVIYSEVGTGGRTLDSNSSVGTAWQYANDSDYGFTLMTLAPDGLNFTVQFWSVDNEMLHEFKVTKSGTGGGGSGPPANPQCPVGYTWNASTQRCERATQTCPNGQHWDAAQMRCVDDSTPPTTCPTGQHYNPVTQQCENDTVPPPTTGEVDPATGIEWKVARGPIGVIENSRNDADDWRWSQNVQGNQEYGIETTIYLTNPSLASDGHMGNKMWGGNHSGDCQYEEGGSCCCWYDFGVRAAGNTYAQHERPHPSNSDEYTDNGSSCIIHIDNIGRGLSNALTGIKWLVKPKQRNGTADNGGVDVYMWVDTSGFSNGRPQNQWRLAIEVHDTGQYMGDYTPPSDQDVEARQSGSDEVTDDYGGYHWRKCIS